MRGLNHLVLLLKVVPAFRDHVDPKTIVRLSLTLDAIFLFCEPIPSPLIDLVAVTYDGCREFSDLTELHEDGNEQTNKTEHLHCPVHQEDESQDRQRCVAAMYITASQCIWPASCRFAA